MTITVTLNTANNFFQQIAGLSCFFDIQSFYS
jgi:beta-xylosidase